jgi:hypothetical protein
MSKMKHIIFLFILLVVTIASGVYFINFRETFTSSSEEHRGKGIGDRYAAPLDLSLNTDNTRFFGLSQIPTNM